MARVVKEHQELKPLFVKCPFCPTHLNSQRDNSEEGRAKVTAAMRDHVEHCEGTGPYGTRDLERQAEGREKRTRDRASSSK